MDHTEINHLRERLAFYTDAPKGSNKPVYHDLMRLARDFPGFTGYLNSTPIEAWTEERRLRRWYALKAAAKRRLDEFENGKKTYKSRRDVAVRILESLRAAGTNGLGVAELYQKVYGRRMRKVRSKSGHVVDRHKIQAVISSIKESGYVIENIAQRLHSPSASVVSAVYVLHGNTDETEAHFEPDLVGLA